MFGGGGELGAWVSKRIKLSRLLETPVHLPCWDKSKAKGWKALGIVPEFLQ